ncbi:MAG TPA: tetratricopeptide repeat protein [Acidobacteriaceae bacterium]|nr:tetratricopeptide repeat protein [Acidobacteriaceae bacterium]
MLFPRSRQLSLTTAAAVALAFAAATFSAPAAHAQALTVPAQSTARLAPPDPDAGVTRLAESKVIASIQTHNFAAALTGARAILAANPDSPKANKLVGVVLLDQHKAADALPYFQKALQISPYDPTVNALLLQAYAESGDKVHRDQQIAILRRYHDDGQHPVFTQIPSFLIETIPVGDKTVQAAEFYKPSGQFHFFYRFNVYDANGHLLSFLALESDDSDQPLYAKEHPKQAAAGQRRFSLDGYSRTANGKVAQALFMFFNGQPSYDDVRNLVVKLVQEGKEPVSASAPAATITAPSAKSKK